MESEYYSDVMRWRRELTNVLCYELALDYQAGSNDPSSKDAWDEYVFRVDRGVIRNRMMASRCKKHRAPIYRRRRVINCPDCKPMREVMRRAESTSKISA